MGKINNIIFILFISSGFLFGGEKSEVSDAIKLHWKYQNKKDWKKFVTTLHSSGVMNGDSNGSFWFKREPTIEAITQRYGAPKNKFDFTPRYIEVDILEEGKVAVAYYYLVGSLIMNGVIKNDYRTRVSQIFVKEGSSWKVKSGHFSPLHSGSGVPN